MKTKIDVDSRENQEIKSRFVEREVKACFSYEMEAVLQASLGQGGADLPTYDDIENTYEERCPECGEALIPEDCKRDPGDGNSEMDFKCPSCKQYFDEPEQEPQEIFEWWIVSKFLYDKLKAAGEPVLEWGNNHYWGRTTTGQSIMMDGVISGICAGMEILDGQKYSWGKK